MKNLNEQLNRMKSLMSEERLYGNLVDKQPINEWKKAIDDIIKGGSYAAKDADEALDVMIQAEKYFNDLKAAKKIDDVPKLIDDIAKSQGSGTFEVILKDFSRNIDTVDDFIRHFEDFKPIYKASMSPRGYEVASKFMSKISNLKNLDIMMDINGVPYFLKLPKEMDFNWVVFQKWFKLQDELTQIKTLEKLGGKPSSGSNISALEDLSDMAGKTLKKGDDVVDDAVKGGDDVVDDAVKGGDEVVEVTGKGGDDLSDAIDDVVSKTEKGDNISININVNSGGGKSGDDAVEGIVTSKTGDEIVDETTEQLVKGMGEGGEESLKKGNYWNRYWDWVNKSKWRRNLINPLTIKETMPDFTKSGLRPGLARTWRISSRTIPTWYIISYLSGGYFPGPQQAIVGLWNVLADSKLGQTIANILGKDTCAALYDATDGIVDCDTVGYEIEQIILKNAKNVDCKVLEKKSDEDILNDLYSDKEIEQALRVMVKKKYEEKKGSVIAVNVLNNYMTEIRLAIDTIKTTDSNLKTKLKKEIQNQRDLCVHDKFKKDASKSGYELDEMKNSDNTPRGGGGSQGDDRVLPSFD